MDDPSSSGEPHLSAPVPRALGRRGGDGSMIQESSRELTLAEASAAVVEVLSLRAQMEHLRIIVQAVPALAAYVDATGHYRFVNRSYELWFGKAAHEMAGRHMEEVLGAAAMQQLGPHVNAVLAGQQVRFAAHVPFAASGERWVEGSFVPHLNEADGVVGFVALVADITEQRQLRDTREAAASRTERLMRVTAAIADAVTREQVYDAVVDQVAVALDASTASLWLCNESGTHASLVRSVGFPANLNPAWQAVPLDGAAAVPAIDAIIQNDPVWIESQQELTARYPDVAKYVTQGRQYRTSCLPILVQDHPVGSIALTFDNAPPPDEDEKHFLLLVARYTAQALERLRLLEDERHARERAEAAAARMALLSRASRTFSEAGVELSALLATIAREVTAELADCCTISLVPEQGDVLEVAAVHHRDPHAEAAIFEVLQAGPIRVGQGLTGKVAETGERVLLAHIDPGTLSGSHPAHKAWLEQYEPRSLTLSPLRVRGRVIGVLTAVRHEGWSAFNEEDAELLGDLADRAALAIDAAKLQTDSITARQRAERLYHLAKAVIRAENVTEIFAAALDAIEGALGAERSSILAYDDDGVMRFKAWRGLSERYRQAVEGHSPWTREAVAPEPIWVHDVRTSEAMAPYRSVFEREGIGALGFVPLVAGDALVGKFMVYFKRPRTLTPTEEDMAKAIANHVATAIARFAAITELQQTVRFNEMFTAILGHDLRNPLGAIMTAAQVASKRDDDGKLARPLGRILSSGHRMARMIDQLLDFTRVRVGNGIPISPRLTDVSPVLRQVIEELEDSHPECGLRLVIVAEDTTGMWDGDRLSQVFSNLVANAVQHGDPADGVSVRVEETADARVLVEIHNSGVIPPQLLPRLFEPMAGGDRRRDKSHGLGLGLYISREIIRAHGGNIHVRSSENEGTFFVVLLPREAGTAA